MSKSVWLYGGLFLAFILEAQTSRSLRGEVVGGDLSPDRLMVEIAAQGRAPDKTSVLPDGTFEFRGLAEGQYELKVVNFYGDVIRRQFVSVPDQSGQLTLKLPERRQQRPVSGAVSLKSLLPVPSKARKEFERGEKLFRQGKVEESAQRLEKAIRIHPDYLEARNNLGVRYMRMTDFNRAAAEFQKAIEIDPGSTLAQTNLALALTSLGRYREAETAARRALASDPSFVQASYALGLALLSQNDCSLEATTSMEKASLKYPKARLASARLRACRGEVDQAANELRLYLAAPDAEHRQQVESWLAQLSTTRAH